MRVLCRKIILFVVLLLGVSFGIVFLSAYNPFDVFLMNVINASDYEKNEGLREIAPYIEKVQQRDGTTKLIVGDSMCHQMFNGLQKYNSDYTIVGSNGAITLAGQYLLVNEYLKNHENVTDICMFFFPGSLSRSYDTKLGYQYVVMPFGNYNLLTDLEPNTIEDMASVYGEVFLNQKVINWMEKSAVGKKIYYNLLKESGIGYVEKSKLEIANQYVKKIYELCEQNNIRLHFYPSPVAEHNKETINSVENGYYDTWLGECFPDFFEKIYYFPDEQAEDGVHFSGEYAEQKKYNDWIRKICEGSELLNSLKLKY